MTVSYNRIEARFKIEKITIITESAKRLFASNPPPLYEETKGNLEKLLNSFLEDKFMSNATKLIVYSKTLNNEITLRPVWSEKPAQEGGDNKQ